MSAIKILDPSRQARDSCSAAFFRQALCFASLSAEKTLSRAPIQQLIQFLPRLKAEALVAALAMPTIAESEHARSEAFDSPESVYRACSDLKLFNQEVLRVLLLDTRQRLITTIDVTKGGLNESLAYPMDIFRPVIVHSAYSFIPAHNHPSGAMPYPVLCRMEGRVSSG